MRDMDLVRELLLKIEGGQTSFETISSDGASFLGIETETSLTGSRPINFLATSTYWSRLASSKFSFVH